MHIVFQKTSCLMTNYQLPLIRWLTSFLWQTNFNSWFENFYLHICECDISVKMFHRFCSFHWIHRPLKNNWCHFFGRRISNPDLNISIYLGGKYLVFVSSRSVKMRGFSFLSLHAFWGKCVYFSIFEW